MVIYKRRKRFSPDAPWITQELYDYLTAKLEPKYHKKARARARSLIQKIYNFTLEISGLTLAPPTTVAALKIEMARHNIVETHYDFYYFIYEFMPRAVQSKVNPDTGNKIPVDDLYDNII